MFYCASTDLADSCPKAETQEQRGLSLHSLASRLQKQKARSNPYVVIFNFIGYYILVLHDFPLPSARWLSSCSNFSGFISLLCRPYLPATFSGLRPSMFFSDPPPCYMATIMPSYYTIFMSWITIVRHFSLLLLWKKIQSTWSFG
jgi:hypothetical protein